MVATSSTMLPLGTKAPPFELPNVTDNGNIKLGKVEGAGHLIAFVCNHCPFVVHLLEHLSSYCNQLTSKGLNVYLISSNDIENYPADSPRKMKDLAVLNDFHFPYLFDEDQSVAKAYKAACTPDFFLFDSELSLYYRGRYDDSRPGNELPVTGNDLQGAVESLLADKPPPTSQLASMGCNIKWKPDNQPEYFNA